MKTIFNTGQSEDRLSSFKRNINKALRNATLSFLIVNMKILAYEWMNSELILGGEKSEVGVT